MRIKCVFVVLSVYDSPAFTAVSGLAAAHFVVGITVGRGQAFTTPTMRTTAAALL